MEVTGLLDSLATLCSKDVPDDLVTLAFTRLQPVSPTSLSSPPIAMWHVDQKSPTVEVDCFPDVGQLLGDEVSPRTKEGTSLGSHTKIEIEAGASGGPPETESGSPKSEGSFQKTKKASSSGSGRRKTKAKSGGRRKDKVSSGCEPKVEVSSDDHSKIETSPGSLHKVEADEEMKESCDSPEDLGHLPNQYARIEVKKPLVQNLNVNKFSFSLKPLLWIWIEIGSVFRTFVDSDPYSDYGSGSSRGLRETVTKSKPHQIQNFKKLFYYYYFLNVSF